MQTVAEGYLHGYSATEQRRLYRQARFQEPYIYDTIDFRKSRNLLEVGCGVGAQTAILLRRFRKLHITGIDASPLQIGQARRYLKAQIQNERVDLSVQNAE